MKKWFVAHKNEIIVGTICTIASTIIISTVHSFVTAAPKVGNTFIQRLINNIYVCAAKQSNNTLLLFVVAALIGVFVSFMFRVIIDGFKYTNKEKLIEETTKTINEIKAKVDRGEIDSELEKAINKILVANKEKDKKKMSTKKFKMILFIFLVLIVIVVVNTYVYVIYPTELRDNFERAVTKITPYIDQKEVLTLRSEWTQMTTRDDYYKIDAYIKKLLNKTI